MSKGGTGGNGYSKVFPIIVGAISGGLGLIGGIFLGDHFLSNHYHESSVDLQQQVQYLKNEVQELQQQELKLQNEVQNLEQQVQYLGNQDQQLQQQVQYLQNQEQYIENQLQYLQNRVQYLENEVQYLQNQNQGLEQQIQNLQNQVQNLESLLQSLESAYQNAEQQLQNIYTLTKILYGNNNDISVIQIDSITVENETAYVSGTVSSSGDNVILEIPVNYVENGNVNIQEFVSVIQQYQQNGWNTYIAIDRADLQYMTLLNNQNGTYVISIQPNEPINIGVIASPANGSTLDNVLNQLTKYNIVIQDGSTVYGSSTALWGWNNPSESSVIVNFQNSNQYQLAETMINIADDIINSPGNQNPTSSGIIYTYSIFQGSLTINTNQGYPQYNVGSTYIPLIVLQSGQGNTIISDVSS
jgi:archaellum component FlaC